MDNLAAIIFTSFVLWTILTVVVAKAAAIKGRNFWQFFIIGFFISPLLAFIIVATMAPLTSTPKLKRNSEDSRLATLDGETLIKCPKCAEFIKADASICRYCHSDISDYAKSIKTSLVENEEAKIQAQRIREDAVVAEARAKSLEAFQKRAAAKTRRRKLYRSPLFLASTSLLIVVLAVTAVIYGINQINQRRIEEIKASQQAISWESGTKQIWLEALSLCNVPEDALRGKSIIWDFSKSPYFDVKTNKETLKYLGFYDSGWSSEACLVWNLAGVVFPDERLAPVELNEHGITWTPLWSTTTLRQAQDENAPGLRKLLTILNTCTPGLTVPHQLTDKDFEIVFTVDKEPAGRSFQSVFVESAVLKDPTKKDLEPWNTLKNCVLAKTSIKTDWSSLAKKYDKWYDRSLDVNSDSESMPNWYSQNPMPTVDTKLDGINVSLSVGSQDLVIFERK